MRGDGDGCEIGAAFLFFSFLSHSLSSSALLLPHGEKMKPINSPSTHFSSTCLQVSRKPSKIISNHSSSVFSAGGTNGLKVKYGQFTVFALRSGRFRMISKCYCTLIEQKLKLHIAWPKWPREVWDPNGDEGWWTHCMCKHKPLRSALQSMNPLSVFKQSTHFENWSKPESEIRILRMLLFALGLANRPVSCKVAIHKH
jgi:hypothetical protein